ncbi:ABC transporter substrate-binding protein [Microbispora sp. CA-102843]|uniref:ABC transporter substrate-binding protein n=1 Tax=Microbispora sp. CA-102843 TaxID=3239952 RepID=UPI003D8A781D
MFTRRFRLLIAVAGAGAAFLLTACGGTSPAREAGAGDAATTVRIATNNFLLGTQMWVAMDKGYFAEQKIKVEPQMYQEGIDGVKAVVAGQADLAPALDFAALSAASDRLRILGAIASPAPGFHKLAVTKKITSPKDLVGKRIGYVDGTLESYVTMKYLEQQGVAQDQVTLTSMPGLFEMVGALKTGQIDAAWIWANGVDQAKADPNLAILTDDKSVRQVQSIFLVGGTDFVRKNPAAVEGVLRAYQKATDDLDTDTAGAAKIVASGTKGDLKALESGIPSQGYELGLTTAQMEQLIDLQKYLVGIGKLKDVTDVSTIMDLTAMRAVAGPKVEVGS